MCCQGGGQLCLRASVACWYWIWFPILVVLHYSFERLGSFGWVGVGVVVAFHVFFSFIGALAWSWCVPWSF